jgi:hypothetical protein
MFYMLHEMMLMFRIKKLSKSIFKP